MNELFETLKGLGGGLLAMVAVFFVVIATWMLAYSIVLVQAKRNLKKLLIVEAMILWIAVAVLIASKDRNFESTKTVMYYSSIVYISFLFTAAVSALLYMCSTISIENQKDISADAQKKQSQDKLEQT